MFQGTAVEIGEHEPEATCFSHRQRQQPAPREIPELNTENLIRISRKEIAHHGFLVMWLVGDAMTLQVGICPTLTSNLPPLFSLSC